MGKLDIVWKINLGEMAMLETIVESGHRPIPEAVTRMRNAISMTSLG